MRNKVILLYIIVLATMLVGCNKKVEDKTVYLIGKTVNQEGSSETAKQEPEKSDNKNIVIGFVNKLSAEIGMISVIDPVTDEQVNVDGILDGEMIVIGAALPKDVNEIEWAIYNKKGELYSSSITDITKATESVFLILKGNSTLEDIEVIFDKTEDEVKEMIKDTDN